ncbi:cell division protein FtsW [Philodulcilactobacillus myokoensis]|uniref:Cell division protein FtsW n=1 Tax=Philodulcilactobacillus myokoensis TaxID=2929573 RepID=A0A9W6B254_9LACO|nr:FtsW/RodA/SpoVE family cell cycle protein [Philodulcilactobacillus myokoensis]GLB47070.1 cell division protein FtsW [Philodulcilactobacillus myokoensis]
MGRDTQNVNNTENRIDWGIIFCVLLLALIGLAAIYVAGSHDTSSTNIVKLLVSQFIWYAIGTAAIVVIMQFDSEQLWKLAPLAYGFGIFLLVAVLVFYSRSYATLTNTKSWFQIGSLTFQPAEVMKPAYILMMAKIVAEHNNQYAHTLHNDWLLIGKLFLWTIPICVLLRLQPDFGTMLVFFAILCGFIVISGVSWKIITPVGVAGAILGISAMALVATSEGRKILGHFGFQAYQFARIDSWLDPSKNTNSNSYQLWQSMKAIGSGGLTGTGFNVSHVYVPVRESDMIFSVIGENFGFVGGCALILLYLLLIYQMIKVTFETRNIFYAYISTGVIMMILFHVFESIGMNTGLLPLTGIPLPFISQGGSALIGNMMGIGLIMSMQFHNRSYMFSQNRDFS